MLRSAGMVPSRRADNFEIVLRMVREGMLALPSRVAQRLPHLSAGGVVATIDREVRGVLTEIGNDQ
jgi:hypothetical protein